MNTDLLHTMCKEATRKAFNEFKRQIDVNLFPLDNSIKEVLQNDMLQNIGTPVTKHFINNYNLSTLQIELLENTIDNYKKIALETSNNYAGKFLK
ncbi:hypothetical protein DFQ09_105201 [Winogradskyella pacifica]|uniref:Uncharacterized protein n=1 Tax=Winogradskyella pacifica TaxID=664642 RepID=A0A3D9MDM0_9FLAO|nr:hypothetical protein [Winogradskyella pacifica]REE16988.1 hypothetical protein DFQ09_105201 [Winogradskyella pacifica]